MKEKIIMDVDPGIDDSLAILLAGMSPKIELLGLTIVSGNVELNQGARNAIKALEMAGKSEVPVFKGAPLPLKREYVDATDTHGADGIGENYFEIKDREYKILAKDYIMETLKENPHEITLVALGPLTNLAQIIMQDKDILNKAKEIIIMGGAVNVHGNCSPVAEYNFWVDPDAAKIVFTSGIKNITLVPLDATYQIVLNPSLREIISQLGGELAEYIVNITRFYVDFHWQQERVLGCVINDPLALSYVIDRDILSTEDAIIDIETHGIAMGESVADLALRHYDIKNKIKVALGVDVNRFFRLFLTTLFPESKDEVELMMSKDIRRGGML